MMKPKLKVFIRHNCPNCVETLKIVANLKHKYADLMSVELINITDAQAAVPDVVFATPTFMFNNRVVSLGNPGPDKVAEWVQEASIFQSGS